LGAPGETTLIVQLVTTNVISHVVYITLH